MKKNTVDNVKFYSMVGAISLVAVGLLLMFCDSPLIKPEEILAFKKFKLLTGLAKW